MTTDSRLVDIVVERVLRQLSTGEPTVRNGQSEVENSTTPAIFIDEVVVTEEVLQSRTEGITGARTVHVLPNAILTPSARDFLRNQEWKVRRTTSHDDSIRQVAGWSLYVVDATATVHSMLNQENRQSIRHWRSEVVNDSEEAMRRTVSRIAEANGSGVIVIASLPELIACRLNRHRSIRAAVVQSSVDVERIRPEMEPNVYCFDPSGRSLYELRNLIAAITSVAVPQQPMNWQE